MKTMHSIWLANSSTKCWKVTFFLKVVFLFAQMHGMEATISATETVYWSVSKERAFIAMLYQRLGIWNKADISWVILSYVKKDEFFNKATDLDKPTNSDKMADMVLSRKNGSPWGSSKIDEICDMSLSLLESPDVEVQFYDNSIKLTNLM